MTKVIELCTSLAHSQYLITFHFIQDLLKNGSYGLRVEWLGALGRTHREAQAREGSSRKRIRAWEGLLCGPCLQKVTKWMLETYTRMYQCCKWEWEHQSCRFITMENCTRASHELSKSKCIRGRAALSSWFHLPIWNGFGHFSLIMLYPWPGCRQVAASTSVCSLD